jgi:hypothetical protein
MKYKTTQLSLAVYLRTLGYRLVGISGGRSKELEFEGDRIMEDVERYKFAPDTDDRLLVNVKEWEVARKDLLDLLNN